MLTAAQVSPVDSRDVIVQTLKLVPLFIDGMRTKTGDAQQYDARPVKWKVARIATMKLATGNILSRPESYDQNGS